MTLELLMMGGLIQLMWLLEREMQIIASGQTGRCLERY